MTIQMPTAEGDVVAGIAGLAALATKLYREGLHPFDPAALGAGAGTGTQAGPPTHPEPGPPGHLGEGMTPFAPSPKSPIGWLRSVVDSPAAAQERLDALAALAVGGSGLPQELQAPRGATFPSAPSAADTPGDRGSTAGPLPGPSLGLVRPSLVAGGGAAVPRHIGNAYLTAADVEAIRQDFPILKERVNGGKALVWFDNAATTQKPRAVIERLAAFYQRENSNIHRAAHELARRATDAYEAARSRVAHFIGASSAEEIVFLRGATEAINLVANSLGHMILRPGDEILVSELEHHANIVPWQQVAQLYGAGIRVLPVDERGDLRLETLAQLLSPRTRILALTQVSNALGTVTPIQEVAHAAHAVGAIVLVDGAQSVSHIPIDVRALGADFFVFSGHKIFGPTGIGTLYGRSDLLSALPPWQGGGNMIRDVTFERTIYEDPPARFEAGTGNIADAVGLDAALVYLEAIGMPRIQAYETVLVAHAREALARIGGVRIIGNPRQHASVISFVVPGMATADVGRALSEAGIAVRAGHHCAQPILRRFGHESTVRASLAFYNTVEEVEYFAESLRGIVSRTRA